MREAKENARLFLAFLSRFTDAASINRLPYAIAQKIKPKKIENKTRLLAGALGIFMLMIKSFVGKERSPKKKLFH